MKIEVKGDLYDIRLRQEFVESLSGKNVRQTTATISVIDPSKVGAEKYTPVNSVVITQNVKDPDNKFGARKRAVGKLINGVFDKATRKYLWKNVILTDKNIVGEELVTELS